MPNWLLNAQTGLSKFHPAFIKGAISICIGAATFLQLFFSSDEAISYIDAQILWWIQGAFGLAAFTLNQFRDALSAYYTDKAPKPEVPIDVRETEAAKVVAENKENK